MSLLNQMGEVIRRGYILITFFCVQESSHKKEYTYKLPASGIRKKNSPLTKDFLKKATTKMTVDDEKNYLLRNPANCVARNVPRASKLFM